MPRPIQFLFGQFVPQCNHNINKHFEDYYVLQYMEGGEVDLEVGARSYKLHGRWFWSSYPGPRISFHASDPAKTWMHRYLAFRGAAVKEWIEARLFPIPPQQPSPTIDYSDRFDDLLELSRKTDRWSIARASLLLETILTELAEARCQTANGSRLAGKWTCANHRPWGGDRLRSTWRRKPACPPEPIAAGLPRCWEHRPTPTPSPAASVTRGKCSGPLNFPSNPLPSNSAIGMSFSFPSNLPVLPGFPRPPIAAPRKLDRIRGIKQSVDTTCLPLKHMSNSPVVF